MMFARGDSGDKQLFIIGLSRLNITKLLEGKPITITREKQGDAVPEGWEILVTFGETELSIADELIRSGMVMKSAEIKTDPRLREQE